MQITAYRLLHRYLLMGNFNPWVWLRQPRKLDRPKMGCLGLHLQSNSERSSTEGNRERGGGASGKVGEKTGALAPRYPERRDSTWTCAQCQLSARSGLSRGLRKRYHSRVWNNRTLDVKTLTIITSPNIAWGEGGKGDVALKQQVSTLAHWRLKQVVFSGDCPV